MPAVLRQKKLNKTEQAQYDSYLALLAAGKEAGCPLDQMANFTNAEVVLQPKQLQFASYARQCDLPDGPSAIMFAGGRGGSKALALDTKILTENGWSTMGQIKIGDRVFDEQGKLCNVISTSEIFHNHECYELEFDGGEKVIADAGHRWFTGSKKERKNHERRSESFRENRRLTRNPNGKKKPWLIGKNLTSYRECGSVKTTEQIFNTLKTQNGREVNHAIPICSKLDFSEKKFPIHPYLMGVWLGDGHTVREVYSSNDPEIAMRLSQLGYEVYKMRSQKYEWRIVGLTTTLRKMGLTKTKFFPEEYFYGSAEQRLELLRGLMDTDGCADAQGKLHFCNTNKNIAYGFLRLARSLGAKATIWKYKSTLYGKVCADAYKIYLCPAFSCFTIPRKANRQKFKNRPTNFNHYIVSAKRIESIPVKCIAVDSPSHLFLCTESLIPTHNTFALWAQLWCDDCQRFAGLKGLILRKVGKANKEQINDYRQRLLKKLPHNYRQQDGEIIFPNGSKVLLGNFKDEKDIDKYLGQEYDVICISESNQLTFTKKKFILTCLRTSKAGWRPRVYEDTNPGGVGMAENKKIYWEPWKKGCEKETRYVHCTVHDNKFVNPEYVQQLETLTGWQRKAWLYGDWEFAAGAFFTNFVPEYHIYPRPLTAEEKAKYEKAGRAKEIPESLNFDDRKFVRWFLSYDYGFAHNAAAILFGVTRDRITCMVDEYCESEQVISEQAENIKFMVNGHGLKIEDLDYCVAGKDCFNRNDEGKTIAQSFEDEGISFSLADEDRLNRWKLCHSLFGDLSAKIPSRGFVHSRCVNLIDQIGKAQHSLKRAGDIEKFNCDEQGEGGDDCLDAFSKGISSDPNQSIQWATPLQVAGFQPAVLQLGV